MHLGWLALWVGVPLVLGVVAVVLMSGRRDRVVTSLSRWERAAVAVVGGGALMVAAASLFGVVAGVAQIFGPDTVRVAGYTVVNSAMPPFAERSDAVTDAGYESAWLEVVGAPADVRWWLFAEGAMPLLASFAISAAVAWLAVALLRGRPFVRSLPHVISVAAIAVLIGGLGSQLAGAIARGALVDFLDPRVITGGDAGEGAYEGLMGFSLQLDLAPLGWALGLALVAAAFEIGTRLQRDTEGLV